MGGPGPIQALASLGVAQDPRAGHPLPPPPARTFLPITPNPSREPQLRPPEFPTKPPRSNSPVARRASSVAPDLCGIDFGQLRRWWSEPGPVGRAASGQPSPSWANASHQPSKKHTESVRSVTLLDLQATQVLRRLGDMGCCFVVGWCCSTRPDCCAKGWIGGFQSVSQADRRTKQNHDDPTRRPEALRRAQTSNFVFCQIRAINQTINQPKAWPLFLAQKGDVEFPWGSVCWTNNREPAPQKRSRARGEARVVVERRHITAALCV